MAVTRRVLLRAQHSLILCKFFGAAKESGREGRIVAARQPIIALRHYANALSVLQQP